MGLGRVMTKIDPEEQWKLLIGGEWVETAGTYPVQNPYTMEIVGHAPEASLSEATDAMAAARDSLDTINSEYPSGQQILTEENELGDSGC